MGERIDTGMRCGGGAAGRVGRSLATDWQRRRARACARTPDTRTPRTPRPPRRACRQRKLDAPEAEGMADTRQADNGADPSNLHVSTRSPGKRLSGGQDPLTIQIYGQDSVRKSRFKLFQMKGNEWSKTASRHVILMSS